MSYSIDTPNNTSFCVGCSQVPDRCDCIWGKFRELYQRVSDMQGKVEQSWELNYKSDDNLSKRINDTIKEFVKSDNLLENDIIKLQFRIDYLEGMAKASTEAEGVLFKRIEKLESSQLTQQLDPQVWKFITERIDGLETEINTVRALGSRAFHPKKPHKCPVCDGLGVNCVVGEIRGLPIKSNQCHGCEGKGYLWG